MNLNLNKISRAGLDAASVATSVGFTAAKLGTKLGVRSLTPRITAHPCLTKHTLVLHNTRHHHNSCWHYWLRFRLRLLWRAHQHRTCAVECCGLHALRYRANHAGPDTHIGILDIDLVHRGDWFIGSCFRNRSRRGRSYVLSR